MVLASSTASNVRSRRSVWIGEHAVGRSGMRASMSAESSAPTTRWPSAASGRRIRPVPQPSSRIDAPGGTAACTISGSPNDGSNA